MVRTYGQTPAQLFRAPHPLIQNLGNIAQSNQTPQVIEGISGNYHVSFCISLNCQYISAIMQNNILSPVNISTV